MNVMAQAHKATKAKIAYIKANGLHHAPYSVIFKNQLRQAHIDFKAQQAVAQHIAQIEARQVTHATNRLSMPNRLAYSFRGKKRDVEVYATEQGLFVMCFFRGMLQLNANCSSDEQAKAEAQRWMSFDK